MSDNHEELKKAILSFLKDNNESPTMNFNSFYEAVTKIVPASRAEVAVTATLMEFNNLIKITKDEDGRGMGFALP